VRFLVQQIQHQFHVGRIIGLAGADTGHQIGLERLPGGRLGQVRRRALGDRGDGVRDVARHDPAGLRIHFRPIGRCFLLGQCSHRDQPFLDEQHRFAFVGTGTVDVGDPPTPMDVQLDHPLHHRLPGEQPADRPISGVPLQTQHCRYAGSTDRPARPDALCLACGGGSDGQHLALHDFTEPRPRTPDKVLSGRLVDPVACPG